MPSTCPDREVIAQTFRLVLLSGSREWRRIKPIRAAFLAVVNEMLTAAAEVGEIPEQVFEELIGQFFLDAYIGVVHYWLADRSEEFANTSVLIDRGLNLACALLSTGIANKMFDMAIFLFKTHVLIRMDHMVDSAQASTAPKEPSWKSFRVANRNKSIYWCPRYTTRGYRQTMPTPKKNFGTGDI